MSRFDNDFLARELFDTLAEAQALTEHHRLWYNNVRPHSSLAYKTPAQFAIACAEPSVASAAAQLRPSYNPQALDTDKTLQTAGSPELP